MIPTFLLYVLLLILGLVSSFLDFFLSLFGLAYKVMNAFHTFFFVLEIILVLDTKLYIVYI